MSDLDPRVKLDMQSETLNELHGRTGVVIAAATVASAFLGTAALQRHPPEYWLNVLGLFALATTILLCLGVLWPFEDWEFSYDASDLDDRYYAKDVDPTAMCREMSLGNANSRNLNNENLRWPFKLFRFACGALAFDLLFWLLAVGLQ
jgi:uncharacterized membrane protein YfcA